jgi:hypothetical protein
MNSRDTVCTVIGLGALLFALIVCAVIASV